MGFTSYVVCTKWRSAGPTSMPSQPHSKKRPLRCVGACHTGIQKTFRPPFFTQIRVAGMPTSYFTTRPTAIFSSLTKAPVSHFRIKAKPNNFSWTSSPRLLPLGPPKLFFPPSLKVWQLEQTHRRANFPPVRKLRLCAVSGRANFKIGRGCRLVGSDLTRRLYLAVNEVIDPCYYI